MKNSFVITGTPGTGKSTIARLIAKEKEALLIDINNIVEEKMLYSHIDSADNAKVVHLNKLKEELEKIIKKNAKQTMVIVEGHLACEFFLPAEKVLVLRCDPIILKERLMQRKYSKEKINSNSLSEALDYCTILSEKHYGAKKVFELDTTKNNQSETLKEAMKLLFFGRFQKKERISWPNALMQNAIEITKTEQKKDTALRPITPDDETQI